jgi:hypothetical protein
MVDFRKIPANKTTVFMTKKQIPNSLDGLLILNLKLEKPQFTIQFLETLGLQKWTHTQIPALAKI